MRIMVSHTLFIALAFLVAPLVTPGVVCDVTGELKSDVRDLMYYQY